MCWIFFGARLLYAVASKPQPVLLQPPWVVQGRHKPLPTNFAEHCRVGTSRAARNIIVERRETHSFWLEVEVARRAMFCTYSHTFGRENHTQSSQAHTAGVKKKKKIYRQTWCSLGEYEKWIKLQNMINDNKLTHLNWRNYFLSLPTSSWSLMSIIIPLGMFHFQNIFILFKYSPWIHKNSQKEKKW